MAPRLLAVISKWREVQSAELIPAKDETVFVHIKSGQVREIKQKGLATLWDSIFMKSRKGKTMQKDKADWWLLEAL